MAETATELTDNQIHTILQLAELKLQSALARGNKFQVAGTNSVMLALSVLRESHAEIRRAYVEAVQSAIENA